MAPQPDLPHPAHIDHDSALGRKFGKEVANYFGSKMNVLFMARESISDAVQARH